jgi:hypothetical protein
VLYVAAFAAALLVDTIYRPLAWIILAFIIVNGRRMPGHHRAARSTR